MKMSLRKPVTGDYVKLESWIPDADACTKWAGQLIPFPFPKNLEELLRIDDAHSYSLQASEGAFLGFGQFWPHGEGWIYFGRIIVSPRHRGHGFGKALMTFLTTEAIREYSPNKMTLRVITDNLPAIALYESVGFQRVDQESTEDLLFMERKAEQARETMRFSRAAIRKRFQVFEGPRPVPIPHPWPPLSSLLSVAENLCSTVVYTRYAYSRRKTENRRRGKRKTADH